MQYILDLTLHPCRAEGMGCGGGAYPPFFKEYFAIVV